MLKLSSVLPIVDQSYSIQRAVGNMVTNMVTFKVPLLSKMCVVTLLLSSLCRMMCVESLAVEGGFHTHLLKGEGFSVLTLNLSLTLG